MECRGCLENSAFPRVTYYRRGQGRECMSSRKRGTSSPITAGGRRVSGLPLVKGLGGFGSAPRMTSGTTQTDFLTSSPIETTLTIGKVPRPSFKPPWFPLFKGESDAAPRISSYGRTTFYLRRLFGALRPSFRFFSFSGRRCPSRRFWLCRPVSVILSILTRLHGGQSSVRLS